jgi:hypothetical protein
MYLWFKKTFLRVSVIHFKHGTHILRTIQEQEIVSIMVLQD